VSGLIDRNVEETSDENDEPEEEDPFSEDIDFIVSSLSCSGTSHKVMLTSIFEHSKGGKYSCAENG
jgi:hypothetical protein